MNGLISTYILVLIYSPISSYFGGITYEQKSNEAVCLSEIHYKIGEELNTTFHWEKEMMGPIPKVIGGYCVKGELNK